MDAKFQRRRKMKRISQEEVYAAISTVIDPEVGFNLVDLGLIYEVLLDEKNNIKVIMTLSTRGCPLHQAMKEWVEEAVMKIDDASSCEVEVTWEPEWNITMATEHVKKALSF
jgi:metal-sulfur cluster biosynthetic enzyme